MIASKEAVRRALLSEGGDVINVARTLGMARSSVGNSIRRNGFGGLVVRRNNIRMEKRVVKAALLKYGGALGEVWRKLGVSNGSLVKAVERYGLGHLVSKRKRWVTKAGVKMSREQRAKALAYMAKRGKEELRLDMLKHDRLIMKSAVRERIAPDYR